MRLTEKLSLILIGFLVITAASAQDYTGSNACQTCHYDYYTDWVQSGHHYKLNQIIGAQAPTYPFNYWPGIPNVVDPPVAFGSQIGWSDISYVIGGYYWKARFMDLDGYIITGDQTDVTQWNVWNQEWVAYHAGQTNLLFNCGRCHTTGFDEAGVNPLPGIVGTWEEDGIGCEACHGPGSDHVSSPSSSNITVDETSELCGQCHYRNANHLIAASGTWIQHHEQYDEFLHSPHYDNLTCNTCHDPHPSTVYNQGGLKEVPTCVNCHWGYEIAGMDSLECWDCHMPFSAKSANVLGENQADIRSHQFKIWVTTFPKDSMFYTDQSGTFVKLDANDEVYGNTLDFVCLRCHTSWTIADVFDVAMNIHEEGLAVQPLASAEPIGDYQLRQNFPNPFNPSTTIEFEIPRGDFVNLTIYDITGKKVQVLCDGFVVKGKHQVTFNGVNLASGVYVYRLATSAGEFTKKMLLYK